MSFYGYLYRKFIFPFYSNHVKKNQVNNEYNLAQSRLCLSTERLKEIQWEKLEILLHHCWDNVPYYREKWQKSGISDISKIKNISDFEKLPMLTKKDVQENFEQLIPLQYKGKNIRKSTGGSTGQPFHFELDHLSNDSRQAIMWRGYGWLGAGLGIKTLYLWGDNIGKISKLHQLKENLYHKFYNREMVSTFSMTTENLSEYITKINNYKPKAIVSYVNPLYVLAKYINTNNILLHTPGTMLTGAEPLYEFQRIEIEKAFKCKVYNTYGCREFMLIAAECEKQNGLHINIDHLVVETVDEDNNICINTPGDLVITDLSNYGMPLIRYLNGDRATLCDLPCSCNNPLPMIEKINGRKLDVIKTNKGHMLPGELFPHLLKEFKGIAKFQVHQKTIDSVTIYLVTTNEFSNQSLHSIKNEINKYSKDCLNIHFEFVENIPLTKSGKHRVTICDV